MINRLVFLAVLLFLPFVIKAQAERQPKYHVVCEKETFSSIARQYHTKVDSLIKWNPKIKPLSLGVGNKIIVGWEEVGGEEARESTEKSFDSAYANSGNTNTSSTSSTNVCTNNSSINTEEPNGNNPEKENSFSWVHFLLGLLIGLAIGVVLFYLFYVKKLKVDNRYLEIELNQVKFDFNSEKTSTGSELSRLRSKIQSLDREKQRLFEENVSLGEEIDHLKTAQSRMNEDKMEKTRVFINPAVQQASRALSVLYADAIIDDYFVRISEAPNEDTLFVLNLDGENSANFGIYKPAYPRIVANPSFLEGCEKQILGNTMQLDVKEGRAQRDASNGKWKIIEKLNVLIK